MEELRLDGDRLVSLVAFGVFPNKQVRRMFARSITDDNASMVSHIDKDKITIVNKDS